METYDNFGIFGFSIVDNLGYTSVLNKSEHFWFFVPPKGQFLQITSFNILLLYGEFRLDFNIGNVGFKPSTLKLKL